MDILESTTITTKENKNERGGNKHKMTSRIDKRTMIRAETTRDNKGH